MNFQQARFVVTVAKTRSFTKAAEACFITQPALSNAIHQIEDEIGGKLFSRTTRHVELTELGKLILEDMQLILSARERMLAKATDYIARDDTTIRVGLSPLLSDDYLDSFMKRMQKLEGKIQIVITEMNLSDIETSLINGTIDIGLGSKSVVSDKLQVMAIYEEPLMFISENSAELAEPIRIDELDKMTMLLVQDNCGLANTVRILMDQNSVSIQEYEGRALGYHILEKWVDLGLGVTLLPASKVTQTGYARSILDKQGKEVPIVFSAFWSKRLEEKHCFERLKHELIESSK